MRKLQAHPRQHATGGHPWSDQRPWGLVLITLIAIVILAACSDDTSGDRQFANEPRTPAPTAEARRATPAGSVPVASPVKPVLPETLLTRAHSPETVYAVVDDTLWAIDVHGQNPVTAGAIEAFASSPDGESVAVASLDDTDGSPSYSIDVFTSNGELATTLDAVITMPLDEATPVPIDEAAVALSWSADGSRLLLAHESGQLVDIPLSGSPVAIDTRSPLHGLAQAAWSPQGDVIGVMIRDPEHGRGALALIDPAESPARVNVIAPIGRETSIESFAWLPVERGIVYLEDKPRDGDRSGGKLVVWDRMTNSTRIVATGGQAGPSGSIMWFTLAPDGSAVAYAAGLPTDDGESFNGLFVRSLEDGGVYRVPVGGAETVESSWWLDDGMAWLVAPQPGSGPTATIEFATASSGAQPIGLLGGQGGHTGTPAASPAAEAAGATPVSGTPMASPVPGTPGATPAGGTPAATPGR